MPNEELQQNIEELQQKISKLEKQLNELDESSSIRAFTPGGINWSHNSPRSIDPGHQHVYPPSNRINIFTQFESLDGFSQGGLGTEFISSQLGLLIMDTGIVANDTAYIFTDPAFNWIIPSTKKSGFQTVVHLETTTSQVVYFGAGLLLDEAGAGAGLTEGFGFKIVDNTLSALTKKDNAETLTTIAGVTLTNFNEYKAVFDLTSVLFFVNGALVAKHTANLFDTNTNVALFYHIKTTTSAARTLRAQYGFFTQEI